jgi:serine/threonine-protein kinase
MDAPRELRLLRLAVAHGLVTWDDLESVARRVSGSRSAVDGGIDPTAWLDGLAAAGLLDREALDRLAAEPEPAAAAPAPPPRPDDTVAFRRDSLSASATDARISRDLEVLEGWDRYEVVTFLGAGGMGSVYKVFDPALMRFAAVKVLQRSEPDLGQRLLREARAQARVDHPHVCQVYEAGEVSGRPYIAMQYIDGERLDRAVEGLPRDEVVRLFVDVVKAVHAAHRTGLVHRDLKPGNILVSHRSSGRLHPYVMDFGLAQDLEDPAASRTDVITGTPAYLAPEQIRGATVDRRTDVFSLGVVLYELLVGRTPFAGASVPETLVRITSDDPVRPRKVDPSVPSDLETIALLCLEKPPERRYDSALALAQDLERYLAGEPILARAPSLAYRLQKKLHKHRSLAAVAAVASLAVAGSAGMGLRAQWLSWERTELAQRFGREVTEVEATLRYAVLLPLHDTSEHKRALRDRMERIRREMERLGDLARGPGYYALGQGHLALHEYDEARENLELAWISGYRAPEVATALGRTLGHLYTRALTEADASAGTTERRAYLREIQRAYREPALSYLKESQAVAGSASAYVEGLIALYEGRYDDALTLARQAATEDAQRAEARRLEGDVYVIQGNEALQAGRYDEALRLYDRAGTIYAELLETYRSDAGLYAADCGRRIQSLEVHARVGRLPEGQMAAALATCDRALAADPGLAEAYSKQARIHWRAAEDRSLRGEDPREDLEQAVAAAQAAIALDPRDINAHTHLSVAHRRLADWAMLHGEDPTAALEKAVEAAEQAVSLAPTRASTHNGLGNARFLRATYLLSRQEDPRIDLERAVAAYDRAIELNPRMTSAATNLGNVWKTRAEYEIARGADPGPSIDRAIAALEGALRVNPASATTHNNLGNAHLTLGVHLFAKGADPSAALERAVESYRRSLEINPEYPFGFYNLALAQRFLALRREASGLDPGRALEAARQALVEAVRLNPTDPDNHLESARLELIAGRWALAHGASAAGAARRGRQAVDQALALRPDLADALSLARALDDPGGPEARRLASAS